MSQPEESWVGQAARKALREDVPPMCDLFLHMAAHAYQQPRIIDELESNDIVMDRYYHSRAVYQSIDTNLSATDIEELHLDWSIEPVTTIILDVDAETAIERIGNTEDKFEKRDFLKEVRTNYIDTFGERPDVFLVDATKPQEEVYQEVISILYYSD
jgi:thymidylate kinase